LADWYVSSAAYAAIPQFAPSTAYTVGQIVRPLATPSFGREYPQRCTTAGTSGASEPTWGTANNSTTTSGGATFTNVAGQSAYGWGAAAGTVYSLSYNGPANRSATGDRVFASSDHSETSAANPSYGFGTAVGWGRVQIISVNRAGSVPPTPGDILSGAAIAVTAGSLGLDAPGANDYWQGFTFTLGGTATILYLAVNNARSHYLKNCAIVFTTSSTTATIQAGTPVKAIFDNTTVTFNAAGQRFLVNYSLDLQWLNTANAVLGTVPTVLFAGLSGSGATLATLRGVDLSAVTTTLLSGNNLVCFQKLLLDSCRIAPGVVRMATPGTSDNAANEVELVNCYDGTNSISERHTPAGDLTMSRSTYMTGGALDDFGNFSLQMVSSSRNDPWAMTLDSFWLDVENTLVGVSHTATVELVSTPLAIWNQLDLSATVTLSGGNLTASFGAGGSGVRSTMSVSSGKYYWEFAFGPSLQSNTVCGLATAAASLTGIPTTAAGSAIINGSGTVNINGTQQGATGLLGGFGSGGIACFAFDATAQLIWVRNGAAGNWNGSGTANPATGTGGFSTAALTGSLFAYAGATTSSTAVTANFGASAFTGAVPSGFASGIPGASLSNSDIQLKLEYLPTAGSPQTVLVDSIATPLTTTAALPTSTAAWISPPTTPVYQHIQITFTPQQAGRLRGLVRLGRPNATVYVNPQIAVT
jgi:hypothetical protein